MLGSLKVSGGLARAGGGGPLLHQASMFTGLMAAHGLEIHAGLRESRPFADLALESLSTLWQLQVAGGLSRSLLGRRYSGFVRELELRTRRLEPRFPLYRPAFAAGGPTNPALTSGIFAMSADIGDGHATPREIWRHWVAERPLPGRRYFEFPVYEFEGAAEFYDALNRAADGAPEGTRCLFLEMHSLNGYGELPAAVENILRRHSSLTEIRVRFQNGRIFWMTKEGEAISSDTEEFNPRDPVHLGHDIPVEEFSRARLRTRSARLNNVPPLPALLREARTEAGLSMEDVMSRLNSELGMESELREYVSSLPSRKRLAAAEGVSKEPLRFPILRFLAETYGQDIQRFIAASNLTFYPGLPPRAWQAERYPIYLESAEDARWAAEFHEGKNGKARGTLGWLLFSGRKNPERYLTIPALANRIGLAHQTVVRLQNNKSAPTAATMERIVDALNVPESEAVAAHTRTFHSQLPLAQLFPGQDIFLSPHSRDAEKVRTYAANPGGLGQYLFAARKQRPGFVSAEVVAGELGRSVDYYHNREGGEIGLNRGNLHDWYHLWNRLGLPEPLFRRIAAERYEIPVNHPAYDLAEALEGRSFEEVAASSTISTKILQGLAEGRSYTAPTLLEIHKALPKLNSARLFLQSHPMMPEFFPETGVPSPRLDLAPEAIVENFRSFHFGEALFNFRMRGEPPLSAVKVAKELGWDDATVGNHERGFARIEDDATLLRVADLLSLDRRKLFLYFRPEILRFFPLHRPETSEIWALDAKFYATLTAPSRGAYDRNNLRRKLSTLIMNLPLRRRSSGEIDEAGTLADYLGLPKAQAAALLDPASPLNVEQIRLLTERFPSLSYREWYEHFHRPSLNYFLGRDSAGGIDYRVPGGLDLAGLHTLDISRYVREAGPINSEAATRLLRRFSAGGRLSDASIEVLARASSADRRVLYLFNRRQELMPILEGLPK